MERENDANLERESAGAFSFGRHSPFSEEQETNPFGESATGGGDRGSKLSADIGNDFERGDFGNSADETPKRKRGRPKGTSTKSGGISKLTGDKLAAARGKLADTLSGVVGFGVSFYGVQRANKYKQISPSLAQEVYACYLIRPDQAAKVGGPLADTFITWFPQYVETTSKAIDPGLAIAQLFTIFQQATANEKETYRRFQQTYQASNDGFKPPTNGKHPKPEPEIDNVEETANQWQSSSPTPEEIHPSYVAPSSPSD